MIDADKHEFSQAVNQLFAIYDTEVTDKVLRAWWGVLSPYHLQAVLAAMNLHAGDPVAGMYRPTPAHIRRHLEVTIPAMIRERREAIIREARSRLRVIEDELNRVRTDHMLKLVNADGLADAERKLGRRRMAILGEADVVLAMAPHAQLRDEAAMVAPVDRTPEVVRKALGTLGHHHTRKDR